MRLLLDTHSVLWWVAGDDRLSSATVEAIAAPGNDVAFSVVAIWEISIKASIGKLSPDVGVREAMLEQGFGELPVLGEHALAVRDLPWHHRDPFDRMLVAQARADGRMLVTSDRRIAAYDVTVLEP